MDASAAPTPYPEWRTDAVDRAEDAANTFGFHLMQHCRLEALKAVETATVPTNSDELRELVATAVDTALHNVMDLLEGFWRTNAGPEHIVDYALSVCVRHAATNTKVERLDISPCLLDLPIGYWKWKDGCFQ